MNNRFKGLRMVVCVILLIELCACSAEQTRQTAQKGELEQLSQQISSLEAQIVVLEEELAQYQDGENYEGENGSDTLDVEFLLQRISESGELLDVIPALVTGAKVSEEGCTLKIDRLEYNPDFTPGGEGEGTYLLNAEAVTEDIDAGLAYAQYDARTEGEISERFAEYIAASEEGVQFTLYMLGDELVLASEILVP